MAVKVFPSLAAGNLLNLEKELRALEDAQADGIHFDCMDGHYVPLLTIGIPVLEQLRAQTLLHLDVHLMVTNPDSVAQSYLDAGADTLSFHPGLCHHPHRLCEHIRSLGKRAGIAINPGQSWQSFQYLFPYVDKILIMGVSPGFSRQRHIPETQIIVQEISSYCRSKNQLIDIMVDGGVNDINVGALVCAGANSVVAGGYVFNSSDYRNAISSLKSAVKNQVII